MANTWQEPSPVVNYAANTEFPVHTGYQVNTEFPVQMGYQVNTEFPVYTGYQANAQYQGQMPQYPYFMPPSYGPPNGGNILPTIIYPPNMPPPYPPH
jgi:hypothetical protein